MGISLKPEKKSFHVGFNATPEMNDKLVAFAKAHGGNKSQALRYIVSLFLETDLQKKQAKSQKVKGLEHQKIVRKQVRSPEEV